MFRQRCILFAAFTFLILSWSVAPAGAITIPDTEANGNSIGSAVVAVNLDDDERLELIHANIDKGRDPDGDPDWITYHLAKNVEDRETAQWGGMHKVRPEPDNNLGNKTTGLGAAVADINGNGVPDIIFAWTDAPESRKDRFRYAVAFDVSVSDGSDELSIDRWKTYYVDLDLHDTTWGAGAAVADLNDNGRPDLVLAWGEGSEDREQDGVKKQFYIICWDLDENGEYSSVEDDWYPIPDIFAEVKPLYETRWRPTGIGLELVNLDLDRRPELAIYSTGDKQEKDKFNDPTYDSYGGKNVYQVAWNLNANGEPQKWGDQETIYDGGNTRSNGAGLASLRVGEYTRDMLLSELWNTDGIDDVKFRVLHDHHADTERFAKDYPADFARPLLVRHQGRLIHLFQSSTTELSYRVQHDNGGWSDEKKLSFPALETDPSVIAHNEEEAGFDYLYDTAGNEIYGFKALSDGKHLYVFRNQSDGGAIFIDRFVMDGITYTLNPNLDVRYARSGLKCEPDSEDSDAYGFKDMNNKRFYEPTIYIRHWALERNALDFSVEILPSAIPKEERWLFTVLYENNTAFGPVKMIDMVSFRRAREDVCADEGRVLFKGLLDDRPIKIPRTDENNQVVTDDQGNPQYHIIEGYRRQFPDQPPGFTAQQLGIQGGFDIGLNTVLFANVKECGNAGEEEKIKTGQRLMLLAPTGTTYPPNAEWNLNALVFSLDFAGRLSNLTDQLIDGADYADAPCGDDQPLQTIRYAELERTTVAPQALESGDGFVHVFFKNNGRLYERVYDPLSDGWVERNWPERYQIKGGYTSDKAWPHQGVHFPFLAGIQPIDDHIPSVVESGAYAYDGDGNLIGELRRAFCYLDGGNLYVFDDQKVGDLEADYLGQNLIDTTLVGYIEGAPPVPKENLDDPDTDYNYITAVDFITATSSNQTYAQSRDAGIDFQTEGKALYGSVGAAWNVEMSYGWLSENTVGAERTETIALGHSLQGQWNPEEGLWNPYNQGLALLRGKIADVYGLRFEDADRYFSIIQRPMEGPAEEYVYPFVIDDAYVKNGTLDGCIGNQMDPAYGSGNCKNAENSYKKTSELKKLQRQADAEESRIAAFYDRYKSHAFQDVPDLERIKARNILNVYDWNASGGYRAQTISHANTVTDSVGGSFNFLGMAGVAVEKDLAVASFEMNVMAGGHINREFTKTKESYQGFELDVVNEMDGAGILGEDLTPLEGGEGKVDYYKWKTFYLSANSDNFNEFYDRVVDLEWLENSNSSYATTLRDARSRANNVWRIRHFVTFVSRPYETAE